MEHTPTPWIRLGRLVYALEHCGYRKGEEQFRNRFSASIQAGPETPEAEALANAAFIIQAVNSHEALVTACQKLMAQYDSSGDMRMGGNLTNGPFLDIREALAKLEEQDPAPSA